MYIDGTHLTTGPVARQFILAGLLINSSHDLWGDRGTGRGG